MKVYYLPLMGSILISLLTLGVLQRFALGNPQTQDTKSKRIEVRLIPQKKSIRAGEILNVRVEIWNVGSHPLYIEQAIYELCRPISPLSLRLELGPPMKPQERRGWGCASDCVYGTKDTFASRLVDRWTSLPAASFYGTVVAMDPDSFPQLKRPGRWRLRGTYKSMGDLSSEMCFDTAPLADNKEQIKALSYEPWQGDVEANTVWIEVERARVHPE